jgi:hypothetical protein
LEFWKLCCQIAKPTLASGHPERFVVQSTIYLLIVKTRCTFSARNCNGFFHATIFSAKLADGNEVIAELISNGLLRLRFWP